MLLNSVIYLILNCLVLQVISSILKIYHMENTPLIPESREEKDEKESSSKKKKSAESIGAFIIEPKEEKIKKPEGMLDRLLGKTEKPIEDTKEQPPVTPESEKEAPLESLSEAEKHYVEAELITAAREESSSYREDGLSEIEQLVVEDAVESFRDKIVEDDKDSEAAFQATLDEIGENTSEAEEDDGIELNESEPIVENNAPLDFEDEIDLRTPPTAPPAPLARPPTPPTGPTPPPAPRQPDMASPASQPNMNLAPSSASFAAEADSNASGMFIVGGIVGNLIGRRRGRIKTEKRLIPIQNKLEKQVSILKNELVVKEEKIRTKAIEQVRRQPPTRFETRRRPERFVAEKLRSTPERIETLATPLERIGRVVVNAETTTKHDKKAERLPGLNEKDVVTMNRNELLLISEKIIIEGSSLRHIYETHLVTEKGMRRILVEYLRGGDLQKALRRELVEREIDFERDPILRDKGNATISGGGTDNLIGLIEKAGITIEKDSSLGGVSSRDQIKIKSSKQKLNNRRRQTADVAMITVIVVLIGIILALLLTRHGV